MQVTPWVSFCMSTYRRPSFLRRQLLSLLQQRFQNFEIIVSDNDPDASGKMVTDIISDNRIKYYHNGADLGMITSFNKSIDRASADFIVMVTDDDPVQEDFLYEMNELYLKFPGYSLYGGFGRRNAEINGVEIISSEDILYEMLDPKRTLWLLWSSCILERKAVLSINKIPDYGSPHLADHALIVMAGRVKGGVIVNKKFSLLNSHANNFSKLNFDYYRKGCEGFYDIIMRYIATNEHFNKEYIALTRHLKTWLIGNIFNLKRYYTVIDPDSSRIVEIDRCARQLLGLSFMKRFKLIFYIKQFVFQIKRILGVLKLSV